MCNSVKCNLGICVFLNKSDSQVMWKFQTLHVLVICPPTQLWIHFATWVLQVIYNLDKLASEPILDVDFGSSVN